MFNNLYDMSDNYLFTNIFHLMVIDLIEYIFFSPVVTKILHLPLVTLCGPGTSLFLHFQTIWRFLSTYLITDPDFLHLLK